MITKSSVLAMDLHMCRELVRLESHGQDDNISRNKSIRSLDSIGHNLSDFGISQDKLVVVQALQVARIEDPAFTTDVEIGNEKIVVLRGCHFTHVCLDLLPAPRAHSGSGIGHRKQAEVILCCCEDVETMELQGEWNVAKDPNQRSGVLEVGGFKYPVLRADYLME